MTETAAPTRPRPVTSIANVCVILTFFLLFAVAAQIPGLLPHSQPVTSPPFIQLLVVALLSALGFVTCVLLRRMNRYALLSFELFWLAVVACSALSYVFLRNTHDVRGLVGMGVLLVAGVICRHSLQRSLPSQRFGF